jgi:oxygen-independent coproporphyrinogen-3 oxidase
MEGQKSIIEHLYVHIPFCTHICPYCSFYKHKNHLSWIQPFILGLQKEMEWAQRTFDLKLKTIYFGGGTPSALSISQLEILFAKWSLSNLEEITIECNPDTVSLEKAELLKKIGATRISLGVQSFNPSFLKILGRTHDKQKTQQTIENLRSAGFKNINIDLMYGLPDQKFDDWKSDLQEAVALAPQHISAYNLTYEEDTEFFQKLGKNIYRFEEETNRICFEWLYEYLPQQGISFYEISNFAKPGFESIHNQAYWSGKDYLGLGPGAFSTVGFKRWQNVPDTLKYIQSVEAHGFSDSIEENLNENTKKSEKILLGLRTKHGVNQNIFEDLNLIDELIQNNMAEERSGRIVLTQAGLLVADSIAEMLI